MVEYGLALLTVLLATDSWLLMFMCLGDSHKWSRLVKPLIFCEDASIREQSVFALESTPVLLSPLLSESTPLHSESPNPLQASQQASVNALQRLRNVSMKVFVQFCSFAYLILVFKIAELYDCTEQPDGTSTLTAQPSLKCRDELWHSHESFAAVCMLLYGLILSSTTSRQLQVSGGVDERERNHC